MHHDCERLSTAPTSYSASAPSRAQSTANAHTGVCRIPPIPVSYQASVCRHGAPMPSSGRRYATGYAVQRSTCRAADRTVQSDMIRPITCLCTFVRPPAMACLIYHQRKLGPEAQRSPVSWTSSFLTPSKFEPPSATSSATLARSGRLFALQPACICSAKRDARKDACKVHYYGVQLEMCRTLRAPLRCVMNLHADECCIANCCRFCWQTSLVKPYDGGVHDARSSKMQILPMSAFVSTAGLSAGL